MQVARGRDGHTFRERKARAQETGLWEAKDEFLDVSSPAAHGE